MKNHSSACDSSTGPSSDGETQRLLSDAYDVPPLPRSLLKRLDRAVEAEWGHSPRLAGSRTVALKATLARGSRLVRSIRVAAGVVVAIALVVLFSNSGRAYGWAAMLKALAERGVVQVETADGTRWLSLSESVLGERAPDVWRLVDLRRRVVLERDPDGQEVRRRRLPRTVSTDDPNRLVLGFLLGGSVSAGDAEKLRGVQVVDEDWRSLTVDGQDRISLRVSLAAESSERHDLTLLLDPATHLPVSCELSGRDGEPRSLALSYPAQDVSARRERDFPAALPVVDLDEPVQVAADDRSGTPAESVVVAENPKTPAVAVVAVDTPPMFGVPSKWEPVQVAKLSRGEVVRRVDSLLAQLWEEHGVTPTVPADEELLRRVYLDLAGRTPSVHEVRSYLNDDSPNRYETLVDRLLQSPDHASHVATVWRTFLIPEGVDLARFGGVEAFDQWLARRLAEDDGYDAVVRDLLLAEGRLSRSGPLLFYSAAKLDPDQLASRTARVFLGMRLECAQCHDHPFEPWTQQDFWGFAAFFAQISRPRAELETVSTVMQVRDVDHGEVTLPDSEVTVEPKFLNREVPADARAAARREQLARWLTGADNPYFARATANRVWGHLFGKGVVDPVDDFGTQNSPKSPELLDVLAGHFVHSDYSLRELFRVVALSRAYRLSSGAAVTDERRVEWFAQMPVRTLTAEQVYDCITVATLLEAPSAADPGAFNVARFGNAAREEFVRQFRTPVGRSTEYLGGIPQALTLMNGSLIDSATGLSSSGLLKSLEAPFFTNRQRVEVLYLATLSRRPQPSEWELLVRCVPEDAAGDELREGLADLLWALLNSAEFTLNH
jgi:hypothetical protein